MSEVKLVVMYPRPTDVEAFEQVYKAEHLPLAAEKLIGVTKLLSYRVMDFPPGQAPYHRIAEVYFPSMEALVACAMSAGGQETIAHAIAISTGGAPVMMAAGDPISAG